MITYVTFTKNGPSIVQHDQLGTKICRSAGELVVLLKGLGIPRKEIVAALKELKAGQDNVSKFDSAGSHLHTEPVTWENSVTFH